MFDRKRSLQSSDSPYLQASNPSVEQTAALAEMATFENMATSFGQEHSPFVDDDDEEDSDEED